MECPSLLFPWLDYSTRMPHHEILYPVINSPRTLADLMAWRGVALVDVVEADNQRQRAFIIPLYLAHQLSSPLRFHLYGLRKIQNNINIGMTYLGYPTAFLPVLPSTTTTAATTSVASPLSVVLDPSPLLSSNHLISAASDIATVDVVESARVFEAVAPDTSLLAGFGIVVVLCIVAGYVWANEVVPVSRTKLAISKSRGGKSQICVLGVYSCMCMVLFYMMCSYINHFVMNFVFQRYESIWMVSKLQMMMLPLQMNLMQQLSKS